MSYYEDPYKFRQIPRPPDEDLSPVSPKTLDARITRLRGETSDLQRRVAAMEASINSHKGEQPMRAYNEWRFANHLLRQCIERFGIDSNETSSARVLRSYWMDVWRSGGSKVMAPTGDVLRNKISDAMRTMRRHKHLTGGDR